jgi:hypothetical protein
MHTTTTCATDHRAPYARVRAHPSSRARVVAYLTTCTCLFVLPGTVRADLGQVRLSGSAGPYRVTVLTTPTPLYAGPVEISVFVQDAETLEPVNDATLEVVLARADHEHRSEGRAHLRAAYDLDAVGPHYVVRSVLPQAGRWDIGIHFVGPAGEGSVSCDFDAAPAPPRWQALWPWISWPLVVILLFLVSEYTRTRAGTPHTHPATTLTESALT